MARVTSTKARKPYVCGKCRETIEVGEVYLWAKPGFRTRTKSYRHTRCGFRPSELTTSQRAVALAAIEAFEDATADCGSLDDLNAAWEDLQSNLEEYRDERQAALDEWPNGNSTLEELLDTAQMAVEAVEQHDVPTEYDDPGADSSDDELDEANAEFLQTAIDEAQDVASSLEV